METNRDEELFGELQNDIGAETDEIAFAKNIDSRSHLFNVGDARKYGVECAVILANIRFWCDHNLARGKNLYDGHSWVYNSVKAFSLLFPYFTERQIANKLAYLEKQGAIISGNYNKMKYDRTKWYTTPEHTTNQKGSFHLPKMSNEFTQNVEPIPDINTDKKHTHKEVVCDPEKIKTITQKIYEIKKKPWVESEVKMFTKRYEKELSLLIEFPKTRVLREARRLEDEGVTSWGTGLLLARLLN